MGDSVAAVRVGGQAMPDGVLMRTGRAWAIARSDGSVASGLMPPARCEAIPVLRVLTGLGPALALGLSGGRRTDAHQRRQRRRPPWALLRGIALAEGAVLAVGRVATAAHLPSRLAPAVSIGLMMVAIVVFRAATPRRQWRYHGAEHKAVAAHERGVDLGDVDAVLACPRVHPRCGTNLIAWITLAAVYLGHLPLVVQLPAVALSLASIAEIVSAAGRRPRSALSRLVLGPGELIQRFVTTIEPTTSEQQVACVAITTCLDLHRRLAIGSPATLG